MTQPRIPEPEQKALKPARLFLSDTDPITGREEALSSLFYEDYRGYTIYSTVRGACCIHGRDGCLQIRDKYASFPDIEQAKIMIKHLRALGQRAEESVKSRAIPPHVYLWLNRPHGAASHPSHCVQSA
jgi:hypothetical protein